MNDDYASKADVDELRQRMDAFETKLEANTAATNRTEQNTADLVEMFRNMQGAFGLLRGLAKIAKPVGYIAMAVGAVAGAWSAIKGVWK